MGGRYARTQSAGDIDVSQPNRSTVTEDELFELLSNRRRRHILRVLMREGERVDIGDLSQEIAAREDDIAFDEVASADRKRVYTALQQSHLPKMDKIGVIEFDRDRGAVEATPTLEDVEIYIDIVRGREMPWSDYYLGLTGMTGLLVVASALEVVPFVGPPSPAWAVFVIVTFGSSALAHRFYARRNRLGIANDPPAVELEYRGHPSDD
ncbi:DUF308 domain-containing protein [Natrinema sp. 74]|uniref:DUF7344 domain-containing protein n=1 Tax=Natrinema sp. 74 TaxID=3384159 RepID=UPI0038D4DEEC